MGPKKESQISLGSPVCDGLKQTKQTNLVYSILSMSQKCPFLIALSVFSNVYLRPVSCVPGVASVSGVSILDCPFGFL
jgi:hypothetical protein